MDRSLLDLQEALNGRLLMTAELDELFDALKHGRVPRVFAEVAYPSLKPLNAWFDDLVKRVAFFGLWWRTSRAKPKKGGTASGGALTKAAGTSAGAKEKEEEGASGPVVVSAGRRGSLSDGGRRLSMLGTEFDKDDVLNSPDAASPGSPGTGRRRSQLNFDPNSTSVAGPGSPGLHVQARRASQLGEETSPSVSPNSTQ